MDCILDSEKMNKRPYFKQAPIGTIKLKQDLIWQTGIPPCRDLYFVAELYWYGGGVFGFMEWDGEEWDTTPSSKIVGFIPERDLLRQLNINWPEEEEEQHEFVEVPRKYAADDDDGQFIEILPDIGGIAPETLICAVRATAEKAHALEQQLAQTTPADPALQDQYLATVRAVNDLKACYERARDDRHPLPLYDLLFD